MKYIKFILLLFSIHLFCQTPLLELKIDAITFSDSLQGFRKFKIDYSLTNKTNNQVSFFLGDMQESKKGHDLNVLYQLYQNKLFLNSNSILKEKIKDDFNPAKIDNFFSKNKDSILLSIELGNKEGTFLWRVDNKEIIDSKMILQPNECKKFSKILYWDKKRYYKQDDNEYFLDEKQVYTIEFFINLSKSIDREKLTLKQYEKAINDKNFVKGVFFTPRFELNFKD